MWSLYLLSLPCEYLFFLPRVYKRPQLLTQEQRVQVRSPGFLLPTTRYTFILACNIHSVVFTGHGHFSAIVARFWGIVELYSCASPEDCDTVALSHFPLAFSFCFLWSFCAPCVLFALLHTFCRCLPAPQDCNVTWESPQAGASQCVLCSSNFYIACNLSVCSC